MDSDNLKLLKNEMRDYYKDLTCADGKAQENRIFIERNRSILKEFDKRAAYEVDDPFLLKALLQEVIVDSFEPVIFPRHPFFFEMGLRIAESWGNPCPEEPELMPAGYLHSKAYLEYRRHAGFQQIRALHSFDDKHPHGPKLWLLDAFDNDHHTLNYGLPELRAFSAYDGLRQHGLWSDVAPGWERGDPGARAGSGPASRHHRVVG